MDYSTAVAEVWRHHPKVSGGDPVDLVRYAVLAASSHNTQPWKFRLERNEISILPDFSRRCPAVDPDDHHLYASLGCAVENLLLAAQAAGLHGEVAYEPSNSVISVSLKKGPAARSALFEAIPRRQCTRAEYDGTPVSVADLGKLEEAGHGDGVSLLILSGSDKREQVAEYVAAGNTAQYANSEWVKELRAWIRFSSREAIQAGDGLYGPVMGSPDVPRWMGELYMRFGFSSVSQNRKDTANIRSSPVIAVIVSEVDDKPHWIEAGRCYQRLALQATALELRTAFINQPVEVPDLRSQFANFLDIGNRRPDLVVRVGRGPEMPRTLRRPVDHVVVDN
jgi:hypothetical protein